MSTHTFITGSRTGDIITLELKKDGAGEGAMLSIKAKDGTSTLVYYGISTDGYPTVEDRFEAEMEEIQNDSNKTMALMAYMHHVSAMAPRGKP